MQFPSPKANGSPKTLFSPLTINSSAPRKTWLVASEVGLHENTPEVEYKVMGMTKMKSKDLAMTMTCPSCTKENQK